MCIYKFFKCNDNVNHITHTHTHTHKHRHKKIHYMCIYKKFKCNDNINHKIHEHEGTLDVGDRLNRILKNWEFECVMQETPNSL